MAVIYGTTDDDTLIGLDLESDEAADTIYGQTGNDILRGLNGDDILDGGLGADLLDGGNGQDTAYYGLSQFDVAAYLTWEAGNRGEAAGDRYTLIERLTGGVGNDILGGNDAANLISGGGGSDWLLGLGGDDHLRGGADNDVLNGGLGSDILDGGGGADVAYYGDASGEIYSAAVSGSNPYLVNGVSYGIVVDTKTPSNNFGEAKGDTFTGIENIWGSKFNDVIIGDDAGGQRYGFAGDDILDGGGGDDVLIGGPGFDVITGGAGHDEIFFLLWNDHVNSDGLMELHDGPDTITDFVHGIDHLTVSRYWFGFGNIDGPAAALTSDYADFITEGAVISTKPTFIYGTGVQELYFDPDGIGPTAHVFIADLQLGATLTLSDIWTA
ncbi:calcium-binding protein [Sphingobium sp. AN558]|uniref:calcium-binding protein n=1 Tax=Sphingobium sp. AN558 TaxID=3133442 RepID=UPI0030C160C0